MFKIVEKKVFLDFPRGHHLHCLVSQIPNELRSEHEHDSTAVSARKWQRVRSVLELVTHAEGNLKKIHFLLFPEATLPAINFDEALTLIAQNFPANTVTMLGLEHVPLTVFTDIVQRFRNDNEELLQSIYADRSSGDIDRLQVNWVATVIKETSGKMRVFLQAKSHPFAGEETMDACHDLYHGKIFPLWRSQPGGFNFMALICFDYIYRTLFQSNIRQVIDYANELFFSTRQHLDFLAVLECNPKPEHRVFREVIHGFYGELLEATPGVRESITVFCNAAGETCSSLPYESEETFGYSSVIINKSHKITALRMPEFATDNFGGLPVCRLRFGHGTRLYYFNLPVFYEVDPRTTRMPLKVHRIYQLAADGSWVDIYHQHIENENVPNSEGEQG